MKQKTKYRFINWAKNNSCIAANYAQPQTELELIELVKSNEKIRLVGSGHSWNNICLTDETLVNLDYYNKVTNLDKDQLQITVQAGIKLWQLNEYLDKHKLALSNLGSIAKQSVAGAISTGTHGTGINFQILASQVESFTIIKHNGDKETIHRNQQESLFNQAIINLGALGIISELTLNIIPAFNLHDFTIALSFEEAVEKLPELLSNTDHLKMWWFPHTDKMVVYRYQRTNKANTDSRIRQWFMDEFISVGIYRMLLKIGTLNRKWRPYINRLLVLNFNTPLDRIEKSYKVFNVPEPPLHRESEWAFDIAVAPKLLNDYRAMLNRSNHRINFIQEIRFTKADNYALSPCYKRNSIWLGVYNADNENWNSLLTDFETLAIQYEGRPHWSKEFTVGKDYIKSVYPEFDSFATTRKELDPHNKFANPYIEQLFF